MKQDRKKRYNALAILVTLAVLATGWLLQGPASGVLVRVSADITGLCRRCGAWLYAIGGLICAGRLLVWCVQHQCYKGVRYAFIPDFVVESLARCLLPKMQAYFASPEGQAAFEEWKRQRENT